MKYVVWQKTSSQYKKKFEILLKGYFNNSHFSLKLTKTTCLRILQFRLFAELDCKSGSDKRVQCLWRSKDKPDISVREIPKRGLARSGAVARDDRSSKGGSSYTEEALGSRASRVVGGSERGSRRRPGWIMPPPRYIRESIGRLRRPRTKGAAKSGGAFIFTTRCPRNSRRFSSPSSSHSLDPAFG